MLRKVAAIVVAASLATVAALTSACGQKGPLYVPGIPAGTPWPYPDPPKKSAPPASPTVPAVPGTSDPAQ